MWMQSASTDLSGEVTSGEAAVCERMASVIIWSRRGQEVDAVCTQEWMWDGVRLFPASWGLLWDFWSRRWQFHSKPGAAVADFQSLLHFFPLIFLRLCRL